MRDRGHTSIRLAEDSVVKTATGFMLFFFLGYIPTGSSGLCEKCKVGLVEVGLRDGWREVECVMAECLLLPPSPRRSPDYRGDAVCLG